MARHLRRHTCFFKLGGMWQRMQSFFGVGEDWVRPLPKQWLRTDVQIALACLVLAVLMLQTISVVTGDHFAQPLWLQLIFIAIPAVALVGRRRYPVTGGVVAVLVMFLGSYWFPELGAFISTQVLVFFLVFSAFAWGRDRMQLLGLVGFSALCLLVWMAWTVALASGTSQIAESLGLDEGESLSFGRLLAFTFMNFSMNAIYFGGAIILGTVTWRNAQKSAELAKYSELLAAHSRTQTRQAVVSERLRIARELHDVVAHHVSAIGVHAGAARRVLERNDSPESRETVASTLTQVESSSRQAVTEMRSLLGALRDSSEVEIDHSPLQDFSDGAVAEEAAEASGEAESAGADRSPGAGPGLDRLEELAESFAGDRPRVDLTVVEHPDFPRSAVPPAVSASLYRIAQESVSNVRAHSTASVAGLTMRTGLSTMGGADEVPFAEVEVVDDGRPRHGTAGTGMGQLGMRERARSLGGVVEIGPRALGGYRVRVRLPLVRKES